ncbi:MAG TPA: L-histidine N(alpha)-methyltransferase [Bryobacteraceae bacterium]|nr:L-histidine N(alpha)-methyltransferase [Bryobacteraceae bacterium]
MPASALQKPRSAHVERAAEFAQSVRAGFSKPQKELHSKYLYDELGSALFEAITHLPEYGLTRADERLLREHAGEIADSVPAPGAVIELGSGTGRKTRPVLAALGRRDPVRYFPIDVSSEALARCERELSDIVQVHPLQQSYLDGMASATEQRRRDQPVLVLFLGSTIGNFERPCALEFLRDLRSALQPGDSLLLGADLVKERALMLEAYDDPTGVTAAFNLNLLGRLNRELDADFELRNFEHQARWNEPERRIEMHLVSRVNQTVSILACGAAIQFRAGETIWTESSHKFLPEEMFVLAEGSGFRVEAQWVDRQWPFVESLWTAR